MLLPRLQGLLFLWLINVIALADNRGFQKQKKHNIEFQNTFYLVSKQLDNKFFIINVR